MRRQLARSSRRLWIAVVVFTLYATTIPFEFIHSTSELQANLAAALERSQFSSPTHVSRADVLQNILLFIPFGLCAVLSLPRRGLLAVLLATTGMAALVSLACEALQLLTSQRVSSLWDVYANAAGALIGAIGLVVGELTLARMLPRRASWSRATFEPYLPLASMTALVCIAAWEPFDVTLDVGVVLSKVGPWIRGGGELWGPVSDEFLTTVRFGVLTLLAAKAIKRSGASDGRAWFRAALVCTLAAVVLESSQVFISSRLPSSQDVSVALLGVIASGLFVNINAQRRLATLAVATLFAAIPFYLEPFVRSPHYTWVSLLPFEAYYQRTSLQTVSHVIDLMIIYAPLGFAGGWWRRGRSRWYSLLLSFAIAGALEYSQGWIVGRYPDLTDLSVALLGWGAGTAVAQWLREWVSGAPAATASASHEALVHQRAPRTSD